MGGRTSRVIVRVNPLGRLRTRIECARARHTHVTASTQDDQWWYEPIVCRPFVLRQPHRKYPGEGNGERRSLETNMHQRPRAPAYL